MSQSIFVQGVLVLLAVWLLKDRVPYIGYLPGDFCVQLGNFHLFIPLASGLLLSLAFSLLRGCFGAR